MVFFEFRPLLFVEGKVNDVFRSLDPVPSSSSGSDAKEVSPDVPNRLP